MPCCAGPAGGGVSPIPAEGGLVPARCRAQPPCRGRRCECRHHPAPPWLRGGRRGGLTGPEGPPPPQGGTPLTPPNPSSAAPKLGDDGQLAGRRGRGADSSVAITGGALIWLRCLPGVRAAGCWGGGGGRGGVLLPVCPPKHTRGAHSALMNASAHNHTHARRLVANPAEPQQIQLIFPRWPKAAAAPPKGTWGLQCRGVGERGHPRPYHRTQPGRPPR